MKDIGIGLLGFGTIGAGVVAGLQKNGTLIADRTGANLVLRKIADIDLERDRGVAVDRSILTRDAVSAIMDPGVDVVIELIGGTKVAAEMVKKALEAGKPVVTANKALLAERGEEIFGLAEERNTDIYFEASVGGTIPVIKAIREGLVANRLESICGILNGTCNYILTRMEREGKPFDEILKDAQAKGYAEADPGLDVDGVDTAHKAVILASLAAGGVVPMAAAHVEGIRGIAARDIRLALERGYRVKLLGVVRLDGSELELRVHPALVPLGNLLASVMDVYNAVTVRCDLSGETTYTGRGAGRDPTASAVIADVVDLARNLTAGCRRRVPGLRGKVEGLTFRAMDDTDHRYYLRATPAGKRSVEKRISEFLARHGVRATSVEKKRTDEGGTDVVIMTERMQEKTLHAALDALNASGLLSANATRLRVWE